MACYKKIKAATALLAEEGKSVDEMILPNLEFMASYKNTKEGARDTSTDSFEVLLHKFLTKIATEVSLVCVWFKLSIRYGSLQAWLYYL